GSGEVLRRSLNPSILNFVLALRTCCCGSSRVNLATAKERDMSRRSWLLGLLAALFAVSIGISGQDLSAGSGLPSTAKGDWTYYNADIRGTKYSPLDQINATNFGKLEVAWRFKTDH